MGKSIRNWLRVVIALPVLAGGFSQAEASAVCRSMPCCAASCFSHNSPNKKSKSCHLKKTAPRAATLDTKTLLALKHIVATGFAPSSILLKSLSIRTLRASLSGQSPPFPAAPSGLSPPLA
jgi:hypothetical protein